MGKTIYKYQLPFNGQNAINMPKNAQILSCQLQDNVVTVWALVDVEQGFVTNDFLVVGTGQKLPDWIVSFTFLNTVQLLNGLVFHVFYRVNQ
jgi:hypothetical protein